MLLSILGGTCLEEVDKRNPQGGREVLEWTLSSHLCCWLINQALVFSSIFIRCGQIAAECASGRRRPEEGADCSGRCRRWIRGLLCAGWMSVLLCVCTVYPRAQTARLHTWRQPGSRAGRRKWPRLCQMSCLPQCPPSRWWIWYVIEWRCGPSALQHQSLLSRESPLYAITKWSHESICCLPLCGLGLGRTLSRCSDVLRGDWQSRQPKVIQGVFEQATAHPCSHSYQLRGRPGATGAREHKMAACEVVKPLATAEGHTCPQDTGTHTWMGHGVKSKTEKFNQLSKYLQIHELMNRLIVVALFTQVLFHSRPVWSSKTDSMEPTAPVK